MTTRYKPRLDWTVVSRRRPVRIVGGRAEGGYTDEFEIVCRDCGDDPDLDYREVAPALQQIRGPYPMTAGVTAYVRHARQHPGRWTVTSQAAARCVIGAADDVLGSRLTLNASLAPLSRAAGAWAALACRPAPGHLEVANIAPQLGQEPTECTAPGDRIPPATLADPPPEAASARGDLPNPAGPK